MDSRKASMMKSKRRVKYSTNVIDIQYIHALDLNIDKN